jgi:tRNA (guanine37-N1)-methyltransferase
MKFSVLTLFPEMFAGFASSGVIGRGIERGVLEFSATNIRDFTTDRHKTVDDTPYGGGAGMVMKVEPLVAAVESALERMPGSRFIILSPSGVPLTQKLAWELSREEGIVLLCGRYEGIDERVVELFDAETVSIGDYVLTGGEVAAMVLLDSVGRLVPGVLGSDESAVDESFSNGLLEYPQYTRPPEFRGLKVPEILLSGNHAAIANWRREMAIRKTAAVRGELLDNASLTARERALARTLAEGAD